MPAEKTLNYVALESDNLLEILLHGPIYGESKAFHQLLQKNKGKKISLDINSPGGSVFDGFSVYNALQAHEGMIHAKVSGVAASIASVILMAADTIEMPKNALVMIHKPYVPFMQGDAVELRKEANVLDKMETSIIDIYKTRSKRNDVDWAKLLADTTWYTGQEALEVGLADMLTEDIEVKNLFDYSQYGYTVPESILQRYDIRYQKPQTAPITLQETETMLEKFLHKIQTLFVKKEIPMDNIPNTPATPAVPEQATQVPAVPVTPPVAAAPTTAPVTPPPATPVTPPAPPAESDEVKALKEENATLKAAALAATQAVAQAKVEASMVAKINSLLDAGKVRPIDQETHLEQMRLAYAKDEKSYNDYVAVLEANAGLTGHFASKSTSSVPAGADAQDIEIRRVMEEKKCTYAQAIKFAYAAKPELFNQ
jgi:ATP-dependent protease ClpP protease subunit